MPSDERLQHLMSALRLWRSVSTYEEGCKRWNYLVALLGPDLPSDVKEVERAA